MSRSGTPALAGKFSIRKGKRQSRQLTLMQLHDCAALDTWLTEHGVRHKIIARKIGITEGMVSHHRNARAAITLECMMKYAMFFDTVPQAIFPTFKRYACLTAADVIPSLAKLQPLWRRLTLQQRREFTAAIRKAARQNK